MGSWKSTFCGFFSHRILLYFPYVCMSVTGVHLNFSQVFDCLGHEHHIISRSISSRLTTLTTLTTWTTLTNRTTLTAQTDQTIYQDKCGICIVYLVLFLLPPFKEWRCLLLSIFENKLYSVAEFGLQWILRLPPSSKCCLPCNWQHKYYKALVQIQLKYKYNYYDEIEN